jgi:glutathione synthetase
MDDIASKVDVACHKHGVTMLRKDPATGEFVKVHAPITLQPLPLSRAALDQLFGFMPLWNLVVDRMARDPKFLLETLRGSDPDFTERLLDIYQRVYATRPPEQWEQRMMCGVFRSDYLIHDYATPPAHDAVLSPDTDPVQQFDTVGFGGKKHPFRHVEINTISAAFPALSTRTSAVHHEVLDAHLGNSTDILVSESEAKVVDTLTRAAEWWSSTHGGKPGVVVFVVQKGERNTGDQMLLAQGINKRGVHTVRLTLGEIAELMTIGDDKVASVPVGGVATPVALFYLRALYDVKDFDDESCWAARERMERCTAVKCPSLPYHLCTWKRVQQALTVKAVLRRFADSDEAADTLHSCMVQQYLLHDPDARTQAAIDRAIADPREYVIKTQREGTGSLITGDDVKRMLTTPADDPDYTRIRHEHLLMERIHARRRPGRILRNGEVVSVADLECEIGTYGGLLSDGTNVLINTAAGYLVRTKSGSQEGGGVMSGVSALDTIAVVE